MPDYTIDLNGVPFRVRNAKSRQHAESVLNRKFNSLDEEGQQQVLADRVSKLKDMGIDLDRNFATEGMSGTEKFLVGAGRSFTSTGRGVGQLAARAMGDDQFLQDSQAKEALERETFDQLDSEGIGLEDIGQIAPELAAFIGTGGGSAAAQIAKMGLVGGALGATRATASQNESVPFNTVLGAGSAAVAGGAAAGLGAIFRSAGSISRAGAEYLKNLRGSSTRKVISSIRNLFRQGEGASVANNSVAREIGMDALNTARQMIRQMNATGRTSMFRDTVSKALNDATETVAGVNVLNAAKFSKALQALPDSKLIKELGKHFGPRLVNLRKTFDELGNISNMSVPEAQAILEGIMSGGKAEALAVGIAKASDATVKRRLAQQLVNDVAATAGQSVGN